MIKNRLIPVILISNGGCYKSTKFRNLKYVGDPLNIAKIFNQKLVDELIIMDINASKKGLKPDFQLLEEIASECFMPLSYGGGISSIEDADKVFSLGFEKIILNNILFKDQKLLELITKKYGSQSVIVSIDIYQNFFGKYLIYSHATQRKYKKDYIKLIKEYELLGAGEFFLNSVKLDGTMNGLDHKLILEIKNNISTPLVLCGGLKDLEDADLAFSKGVSGIAGGSYFIYQGVQKAVLISYPTKKVDFADEFFNKT